MNHTSSHPFWSVNNGLGVAPDISRQWISATVWVIAVPIVIHGVSVTPLMNWYQSKCRGRVAS